MRSDMAKIIVERPRRGSALPNKKTGLRFNAARIARAVETGDAFDSGPKRASSAMHQKDLSDYLAPLKRYLMGQVGRPWNKIHSEIHQAIDTRSVMGRHVLQHLRGFVSEDTFLKDGVVYESPAQWRPIQ